MSNFKQKARHPETGKIETAHSRDDYFGPHKYGVEFADGQIFKPEEREAKAKSTKAAAKKLNMNKVDGKKVKFQMSYNANDFFEDYIKGKETLEEAAIALATSPNEQGFYKMIFRLLESLEIEPSEFLRSFASFMDQPLIFYITEGEYGDNVIYGNLPEGYKLVIERKE